ncbi:uncharacterized protein LOC126717674 isoform X1 [Quercus robur]|uniref:uncharacterized protein LOC126717674 isoform X1 n=1 Tax=Quercus robur TaxID=38942 RepID=UPI002163AAFF|nr:uncharacterized protein LOC126717674 isoform X1 [Quercus robur]
MAINDVDKRAKIVNILMHQEIYGKGLTLKASSRCTWLKKGIRSCTSNNNMEAERKCLNCPTFSQDMSKSSYLRLGANGVVVDGLLGWIRVELLTDGILIALIVLKVSASVDVKFL